MIYDSIPEAQKEIDRLTSLSLQYEAIGDFRWARKCRVGIPALRDRIAQLNEQKEITS